MFTDLSGIEIGAVLVSLILSMTLHEAMHGFVAHWLGDPTAAESGRLTLNPLKHINLLTTILMPMILILSGLPPLFAAQPVPFNPDRIKYNEFGVALVGLAGPLTNAILAGLGAVAVHLWAAHIVSPTLFNCLVIFVEVNIAFFVFNMIPFPPLDGSRLLYAFAPEPLQELMRAIEAAGFLPLLLFILIAFEFFSGPLINIENYLLNLLLG
jgi:Zn-dependent protease